MKGQGIKSTNTWLQSGASLVEYALLVALLSVVTLVALQVLGRKVSQTFSNTNSAL